MPVTGSDTRQVQRDVAFLEFELFSGSRHFRVVKRERAETIVVRRARVERDARMTAFVHKIASRHGYADVRQRVRSYDDRDRPAGGARGHDQVSGFRQRQAAGKVSRVVARERHSGAILLECHHGRG